MGKNKESDGPYEQYYIFLSIFDFVEFRSILKKLKSLENLHYA